MKTANPLLVSIAEAAFQLDIPAAEVEELIRAGDLKAVQIRQHVLVPYQSLVALTRRAPNALVCEKVTSATEASA